MLEPGAKVALVHDWLTGQRGGEQVLVHLARLFPQAPIYTLVHAPGAVHPELERRQICTSFIGRLPGRRHFRAWLPLFPAAVASWDLSGFDGIVSSSHCVAHGVRRRPDQWHVAYVHSPMRYLYDQLPAYLPAGLDGAPWAPLARLLSAPLRAWDRRAAAGPTQLLANSHFVAARIRRVWGRPAAVVYPPVDVAYFAAAPAPARRSGLLVVGALVAYKRVALALEAAARVGAELTIVGDGPERPRLERLAGSRVRFVRGASRAELRAAYARARGLLFAGEEDFGMVPVEAMAAGCPVVALARGGLRETVVGEGPAATGTFFSEPTAAAMAAAIGELEARWAAGGFARAHLQAQAARFDSGHFPGRFFAAMNRA